jgi:hypothetical protein
MRLILLTRAMHSSTEILPSLGLLNHQVKECSDGSPRRLQWKWAKQHGCNFH